MDFPVEATVSLDVFPDQAAVRDVLRSHGFTLTDLGGDQVRVKGSFGELKAAKASLEPLLGSQTASAVPKASSGAVSKRPGGNSRVSGGSRGRDKRPSSPNHASPPPREEHRASFSPPPGQRGSFGPGRESFVVDADVFRYAEQLRKKDINSILVSHDVKMEPREVGGSCEIALLGKSARLAAGKLQSLMDDLSKSLRTQEVPLTDMDREGQALWRKIHNERSIYQSVVVCPMNDKLHLIGPSAASYELKQRLLGRPVARTGRPSEKNSKRRSSSLPPISRNGAERDGGATAGPSPSGAASFGRGGALRGRSPSESRKNTRVESVMVQEKEDKRPSPLSTKKALLQYVTLKKTDIKKKITSLKNKK